MSETEIRSQRLSPDMSSRYPNRDAGNPPLNRRVASFFYSVLSSYPRERPLEQCRSFTPTSDSALLVQQVDVATGQLLPLLCIIARGWKEKWKILPWQSNVLSLALSRLLLPTSSVCRRTTSPWKQHPVSFHNLRIQGSECSFIDQKAWGVLKFEW